MTCFHGSRVLPAVTLFILAASAVDANAQTCRGYFRGDASKGGGIAFVSGATYGASLIGVALSKGAFGVGFNSQSASSDVTAWDANLRFNVAMGGRFQVCPGLEFDYKNEDWDMGGGMALKSRIGTVQGGIGFGFEQEVYKGLTLIPFLSVDYQFTAIVFTLDTPDNSEDELSGDTLRHFNIRYGGLARYKLFFAGISGDRYSDQKGNRPHSARLFAGFAFGGGSGGGGKSARQAPVPRPSEVRSTSRR